MKTKHLFEGHVYLISNHSVARNPMFSSEKLKEYFKERMEKYLSPITDIIAYNLNQHEFQILVRLKERKAFEEYYCENHKEKKKGDVPESTYIFSQTMSNLQVSFVKHFNFVYHRTGALVASRFNRQLIKSDEEMRFWIERLNKGTRMHSYAGIWINDVLKGGKAVTSLWIYEEGGSKDYSVNGYLNGYKYNLAGSFIKLPSLTLPFSKNTYFPKTKLPVPPFLD
jgi:hypothetical protein